MTEGDYIHTGDISGNPQIGGRNNVNIGSINMNSLNREIQTVSNEYANSLKKFSYNLNKAFEKYQVPKEKTSQIEESIVALGKEVEGITPGKEGNLNYVKQTKIEAQTVDVVDKVLDAIPSAAEIITIFTPLSPFSKLIKKGVETIVKAVRESKSGK